MWQETHRSKLRATGQSRRQLFSLPLHFLLQNRQDLILHFYREPFKTSRNNPNDRNDTKATRYHCTLTLKQKWVGDLELFSRCQEMMEGTRRYALKGLQCDISVHSFFFLVVYSENMSLTILNCTTWKGRFLHVPYFLSPTIQNQAAKTNTQLKNLTIPL